MRLHRLPLVNLFKGTVEVLFFYCRTFVTLSHGTVIGSFCPEAGVSEQFVDFHYSTRNRFFRAVEKSRKKASWNAILKSNTFLQNESRYRTNRDTVKAVRRHFACMINRIEFRVDDMNRLILCNNKLEGLKVVTCISNQGTYIQIMYLAAQAGEGSR
jgi:hypothetical protein